MSLLAAIITTPWVNIKHPHSLLWLLWQIWNSFHRPFTVAFCNELRKKLLYNAATLSNLLLCYLVKFECSAVQLYAFVIQFKILSNRVYSKYLQRCHIVDCVSVQINLQYYSVCSNCSSYVYTWMFGIVHATLSMNASMSCCCNVVTSQWIVVYLNILPGGPKKAVPRF